MAADVAEATWHAFTTVGGPTLSNEGTTLASGTSPLVPTNYLHFVSGTSAITLVTIPYAGFAGTIALSPTGVFTGAIGGSATSVNKPIGLNFTAVVGKTLFLTYYPSTGLWYPSYTS